MTEARVSLHDVTAATVRSICALKVFEAQTGYVAPNAISIAQAYFEPAAEFRAVHAGEIPVGFMMWRPAGEPDARYLWRFMIDADHQAKGYGRAALALVFQMLRAQNALRIRTSVVLGPASPLDFYRSVGFRETGEVLPNGESVLVLAL